MDSDGRTQPLKQMSYMIKRLDGFFAHVFKYCAFLSTASRQQTLLNFPSVNMAMSLDAE